MYTQQINCNRSLLMSGASVVKVELDNHSKSYQAGKNVEGRVFVTLNKFDELKAVTVSLRGVFVLQEQSKEAAPDILRTLNNIIRRGAFQWHRNILVYDVIIEKNIKFYGEGQKLHDGPGSRILSYPFKFILPADIPSSYQNKWGWVSYGVDAKVDTVKSVRRTTSKSIPINVTAPVDLNTVRGCSIPVRYFDSKADNILLGRIGDVDISIKMPRGSGFVAGESLDFSVRVTNDSNKNVTGMKAWIQQELTCTSGTKEINRSSIVAEVTGPEVAAQSRKVWMPKGVVVPSLPTTTFADNCDIVDIQYFFHYVMNIAGFAKPLKAVIPIVIGSVPLKQKKSRFLPFPPVDSDYNEVEYPSGKSRIHFSKSESPNCQESNKYSEIKLSSSRLV